MVYYYTGGVAFSHSEVIHEQGYDRKPENYPEGEHLISIDGIDRMVSSRTWSISFPL